MTGVRAANGRDFRRVPRHREPVVNRGADLAPAHRRFAGPVMTGYQEHQALTRSLRPLESDIDSPPRAVEAVAVEIDDPIRLDRPRTELPVPCPVERRSRARDTSFRSRRSTRRRSFKAGRDGR